MIRLLILTLLVLSSLVDARSPIGAQSSLTVATLATSGKQREAYISLVKNFQKAHPSIKVNLIVQHTLEHKAKLDIWEREGKISYDVVYWYAGKRLHRFSQIGLLEPITKMWDKAHLDQYFSSPVANLVSYQGEKYAVPFTYYQWGFYYVKSTFEKFGLAPPENWKEMLKICAFLKAKNIYCFIVGTEGSTWTIAAWFDYLNLRINGLNFHLKLLAGEIPFTEDRVHKLFSVWKEIIDKNYYKPGDTLDWTATLPYLYRGKVGMALLGNFIVPKLSESDIKDIGFFRFPTIDPKIPYYEDAPMNLFMIPKSSKNKAAAKKFLAFLAQPASQTQINHALRQIPPNREAILSEDYFVQAGASTLKGAKGYAQFFDRDTKKAFADRALPVLVEFLYSPNIESTLKKLEKIRLAVFK